jgi:MFS family permease
MSPHRRITCAVGVLMFLDATLYLSVLPLLPRYEERFGLGTNGTGVLVASYVITTPIVSLLCIRLVPRLGGKRITLASSALTTVSTIAFALAPSAGLLIGARFIQGVASGAVWAGSMAWVTHNAPVDQRGRESGIVMGMTATGSVVGPGIGALGAWLGTAPAFLGVAAIGGVAVVLTLLAPAGTAMGTQGSIGESIRRVLRNGLARAALGVALLNTLAFGAVDVLVPLDLDERGLSTGTIALAVTVGAALGAVLGPIAGRNVDRLGPAQVAPFAVVGVLLVPFTLAIAPGTTTGFAALLIASPLFAFVGSSMYPLASAGADEAAVSHAVASGLVGATWAAGFAASALIAGWLGDAFGTPTALAVAGAAGLLPLAVVLQGVRCRRATGPLVP